MAYPSDRKYTKDHEWVRLSGDTAEVGITDYAQQQLGDVVFVDLPAVGSGVTAGAAFGTIESVKAVSELFAPVTGEIVAVNERLAQAPEEVNTRPHDTWMVKIHLTGAAPDGLLDSAQYEALLT
ncbi:MAG TPA: glycine cleavage system protein GcvH [Vicinamibacterales bacterium]|jgi:glycine cleavage system H protein|nr:glycine cleavage system protein GcvH [Vicinamibacterales bacterium]